MESSRGSARGIGLGGLLVLVVVVVIVVAVVAHNGHSSDAKGDVKVQACISGKNGAKPTSSGRVDNRSSKTSTYVIRMKFADPQGNTLTAGAASVKSLAAHKSASWSITGATATNGTVACTVSGVTRTHLPGQ